MERAAMGQAILYSKSRISPLVRLFASRVAGEGSCPDAVMSGLVAQLRKSTKHKSLVAQLGDFLARRLVFQSEFVSGLPSEGYIEPVGSNFNEGFRMVLKKGGTQVRTRFTIAHELCHTFFYEIVPELKFGSVEVDPEEERLCNLGAAELLIPTKSLKAQAKLLDVSLNSLEELAGMYSVSAEAMLLRLRSLKLWDCELSFWRRELDGSFSVDRIIGGRKVNWTWPDDVPLNTAWNTSDKPAGRTWLEFRGSGGSLQVRPVCYEVGRRGNELVSLWSAKPIEQRRRILPLFQAPTQLV